MNILNKLQITLLCSFLLAMAACGSRSTTGDSTTTTSPSTTTAPLTASADPRADIVKAMRTSLDAKSYRSRIVTTSSGGHDQKITAEVVAPDRMHMTMEMEMPGRGTVKREMIYLGKESYMKVGDAPWQKFPMGMGDLMAQFRDPKLVEAIAQKAEVKYLGTETLDGAPMLTYQYTIKDLLGPGKDGVSKIWIGATDNLQHQLETESDVDPLKTGKMIHSKVTVTFYDYNADIKIESPM
jgi:hypothetical protein